MNGVKKALKFVEEFRYKLHPFHRVFEDLESAGWGLSSVPKTYFSVKTGAQI